MKPFKLVVLCKCGRMSHATTTAADSDNERSRCKAMDHCGRRNPQRRTAVRHAVTTCVGLVLLINTAFSRNKEEFVLISISLIYSAICT